jgi:hypothetical protein
MTPPNDRKAVEDEQLWSKTAMGIALLVHNLRVDIQANPVVSARASNKLEMTFTSAILDLISAARAEGARKALYKLQMHIPRKYPEPIKDSLMELSRDGEVFNAVIDKVNKEIRIVEAALDHPQRKAGER